MRHTGCFLLLLFIGAIIIGCENDPSLDHHHVQYEITVEELYTLDGPPDDIFGQLRGITITDEGHLYVSDEGYHKVYRFDREGNLVDDYGREGEGPGEFGRINRINTYDDGLILTEIQGRSVHFLTPELDHTKTVESDIELPNSWYVLTDTEGEFYIGGTSFLTGNALAVTDLELQSGTPVELEHSPPNPSWHSTSAVQLSGGGLAVIHRYLPYAEIVLEGSVDTAFQVYEHTVDDKSANLTVDEDGMLTAATGGPEEFLLWDVAANHYDLIFILTAKEENSLVKLYNRAGESVGSFQLPKPARAISIHENKLYTIGDDRIDIDVYEYRLTRSGEEV